MTNKKINQRNLSLLKYYSLLNMNLSLSNSPINRFKFNKNLQNDHEKLKKLNTSQK